MLYEVITTLNALSDLKLLAPDGIICAEAAKSDEVSDQAGDLCKINSRHYGSTSVITSYSIHYTKLYDSLDNIQMTVGDRIK